MSSASRPKQVIVEKRSIEKLKNANEQTNSIANKLVLNSMMMTNIIEKKLHSPVPANICIYKVSDKASDIWSIFENDMATKLWQIQFDHDVRHGIFFQLGHALTEYLKQKSKKSKNTRRTEMS